MGLTKVVIGGVLKLALMRNKILLLLTFVVLFSLVVLAYSQTTPVTVWKDSLFLVPGLEHSILMNNLFNATNYRYSIVSCNPIGNCTNEGVYNFTTLP